MDRNPCSSILRLYHTLRFALHVQSVISTQSATSLWENHYQTQVKYRSRCVSEDSEAEPASSKARQHSFNFFGLASCCELDDVSWWTTVRVFGSGVRYGCMVRMDNTRTGNEGDTGNFGSKSLTELGGVLNIRRRWRISLNTSGSTTYASRMESRFTVTSRQ